MEQIKKFDWVCAACGKKQHSEIVPDGGSWSRFKYKDGSDIRYRIELNFGVGADICSECYEEYMHRWRVFCRTHAIGLANWFCKHKNEIAQKTHHIIGHHERS